MVEENNISEQTVRPILALEKEDVGNLDSVLRGYYLSQIKSLEKRKDRRLARRLLQDHLILPKSRQRTSKDAAYIKEILGIENSLLERLEESRLLRRIHKTGNNPIYEISHDTLVEPILAERRDREAIVGFIKKTWIFVVILLLLWFLFGMLFENTFEVLPEAAREPKRVDILMDKQTIGLEENLSTFLLPLPPLVMDQELQPADSILIRLPLEPISLTRLRRAAPGSMTSRSADTISILFASPIEIPVDANGLPEPYQAFSDVLVPLASASSSPDADRIYAKVSGSLRMTTEVGDNEQLPESFGERLLPIRQPIELELGDTLVQARTYAQSVPVHVSMRLTDLFKDETDKNNIRNILGDREVKLNYTVRVRPAPATPPEVRIEYPAVQGIEVQYSDGTSRFIPGNTTNTPGGNEKIHVVAPGETLFSIAKKYGIVDQFGNTSAQAIKELNGLQGNTLSVGQTLRIPN